MKFLTILLSIGLGSCAELGPDEVTMDVEADALLVPPQCPLPPAARGSVKWNPGHYIMAFVTTPTATILDMYGDVPAVKGIQREYFWSDLEPTRGNYVWDQIDADIAKLAAVNKKLAIIIKYKYEVSSTQSSLPDYVLAFDNITVGAVSVPPYFEQGQPNDGTDNHGQYANFAHPRTRYRFKELLSALSARYDNNPTVASLSFLETSSGSTTTDDLAQDNLFLEGTRNVERYAACVLMHTPVFQNINFPRRALPAFAENFQTYGVGLGGPDVFWAALNYPDRGLGYNQPGQFKGIYHYYPLLAGTVPIGQQVHQANFKYSTRESMLPPPGSPHNLSPSVSLDKVYDFANVKLQPNYMFWQVLGDGYGMALRARLNANNMPVHTACPSVYGNVCAP